MQIQPLAEQFYLYLEAERASSPLTVQAYRADMKSFLGFLDREAISPAVPNVTPTVLRNYLIDVTRRGLKSGPAPPCSSLLLALPRHHRRCDKQPL